MVSLNSHHPKKSTTDNKSPRIDIWPRDCDWERYKLIKAGGFHWKFDTYLYERRRRAEMKVRLDDQDDGGVGIGWLVFIVGLLGLLSSVGVTIRPHGSSRWSSPLTLLRIVPALVLVAPCWSVLLCPCMSSLGRPAVVPS